MFMNLNLSRWIRTAFFFDADGKGGDGQTPSPAEPIAEDKQKELDKQFAERAKRGADSKEKEIFEALGVKSVDDAAALLKIAREMEDKTKTETERLQAQVKTEQEARKTAEDEAKTRIEAANKKLMDSEIKINASTALIVSGKIQRPAFKREALDDVLLLIDRSQITETEGVFKGVDKALEALAKAKPWLLEEPQRTQRGTPLEEVRRRQGGSDEPRTPIISSL